MTPRCPTCGALVKVRPARTKQEDWVFCTKCQMDLLVGPNGEIPDCKCTKKGK